jgi:hypothetical protein
MRASLLAVLTASAIALGPSSGSGQAATLTDEWTQLFNGRDLSGWTPKIAGYAYGQNHASTFRVVDGLLQVRYDQYDELHSQFGHLFYKTPYSSYDLAVEYRFVGEPAKGTPDWALENNGIMIHAQPPLTMGRAQDFPISIEVQLLGGLPDGKPRPTANMCSPGTEVDIDGRQARAHCVNSKSKTYPLNEWVRVEVIVRGDTSITHIVNGDTVMTYTHPRVGGGVVTNYDPAAKTDGTPLTGGYIALQSEGHPIDFRKVEIRRPR